MEQFEIGREYGYFGKCTSRTENTVTFGTFGTFRISITEDNCEYVNYSENECGIYACFADYRERE